MPNDFKLVPFEEIEAQVQPQTSAPAKSGPSGLRAVGALALRGALPVIGAGVGSVFAPGPGTAAGGLAGGMAGEYLAEVVEGKSANPLSPEGPDPLRTMIGGVTGMIPARWAMSPGNAVLGAFKGAAVGEASKVASDAALRASEGGNPADAIPVPDWARGTLGFGHSPDWQDVIALGAGAAGGAVASKFARSTKDIIPQAADQAADDVAAKAAKEAEAIRKSARIGGKNPYTTAEEAKKVADAMGADYAVLPDKEGFIVTPKAYADAKAAKSAAKADVPVEGSNNLGRTFKTKAEAEAAAAKVPNGAAVKDVDGGYKVITPERGAVADGTQMTRNENARSSYEQKMRGAFGGAMKEQVSKSDQSIMEQIMKGINKNHAAQEKTAIELSEGLEKSRIKAEAQAAAKAKAAAAQSEKGWNQEARNLNARDKFTRGVEVARDQADTEAGKMASQAAKATEQGWNQEARNMTAQQKALAAIEQETNDETARILAEREAAAQAANISDMKAGLVENPPTVSETSKGVGPNGEAISARKTWSAGEPEGPPKNEFGQLLDPDPTPDEIAEAFPEAGDVFKSKPQAEKAAGEVGLEVKTTTQGWKLVPKGMGDASKPLKTATGKTPTARSQMDPAEAAALLDPKASTPAEQLAEAFDKQAQAVSGKPLPKPAMKVSTEKASRGGKAIKVAPAEQKGGTTSPPPPTEPPAPVAAPKPKGDDSFAMSEIGDGLRASLRENKGGSVASVKMMLTNEDLKALRELGYTPAEYNKMTPQQGADIIAAGKPKGVPAQTELPLTPETPVVESTPLPGNPSAEVPTAGSSPEAPSLESLAEAEAAASRAYGEARAAFDAGEISSEELRAAGAQIGRARSAWARALDAAKKAMGSEQSGPPPKAKVAADVAVDATTGKQIDELTALAGNTELEGGNVADAVKKWAMEKGEINPQLAAQLAMGGTGGALGAVMDDENRGRGFLLGSAAGLSAIPLAKLATSASQGEAGDFLTSLKKRLPSIQRGNLLFNPETLPVNAFGGPWGAGFWGSVERGFMGDQRGWKAAGEFFNPSAIKNVASGAMEEAQQRLAQHDPAAAFNTQFDEVMRIPSRMMTWGDIINQRLLQRNGFSEEEARRMAQTWEPKWALSKTINRIGTDKDDFGTVSTLANLALPFKRTILNLMESGAERTPGLGLAPYIRKHNPMFSGAATATEGWKNVGIQQAMGMGMATAAYEAGLNSDPASASQQKKILSNLAGPYAFIVNAAFAAGVAQQSGKGRIAAAVDSMANDMPLPNLDVISDPVKTAFDAVANGEPPKIPQDIPSWMVPGGSWTKRVIRDAIVGSDDELKIP